MKKIKAAKPLANYLIISAEKYTEEDLKTESGLIVSDGVGTLKEIQKVIATGDMVRGINVGDEVYFDPKNYAKWENVSQREQANTGIDRTTAKIVRYDFTWVELESGPTLLVNTGDIKYVVDEWSEEDDLLPDEIAEVAQQMANQTQSQAVETKGGLTDSGLYVPPTPKIIKPA